MGRFSYVEIPTLLYIDGTYKFDVCSEILLDALFI